MSFFNFRAYHRSLKGKDVNWDYVFSLTKSVSMPLGGCRVLASALRHIEPKFCDNKKEAIYAIYKFHTLRHLLLSGIVVLSRYGSVYLMAKLNDDDRIKVRYSSHKPLHVDPRTVYVYSKKELKEWARNTFPELNTEKTQIPRPLH
jgi:hypothetical protein